METASRHQFEGYDQRLISIFEILGSYFVDVYYNHVYNSAQTGLKAGGSLTDEYVRRVQSYIVGVKTDEQCYRQVVQNLHRYFQTTTRYTTLSFADFVERIVQQFIPPEYYDLLTSPEKDESLGSAIADLVSGLGAYVTSPDLIRRIIDEHDHAPRVTIRMVQDQGVTILLAKRGEIHNSFLRWVGQAKNTVSAEIADNLVQALRRLAKQKAELKAELGQTEERVLELEDEVEGYKQREHRFKKLIRLLQAERDQGQPAAAYAAAVPPRNRHAELDPPNFGQRFSEIPRADRIAEPADDGARGAGARSASFFAAAPLPAAKGAAAPLEAYRDRAPGTADLPAQRAANLPAFKADARAPVSALADRPTRRAADLSAFMADPRDSSDDDQSGDG